MEVHKETSFKKKPFLLILVLKHVMDDLPMKVINIDKYKFINNVYNYLKN